MAGWISYLAGRLREVCETVGDRVKFPTEHGGAGVISRVELNPSLKGEVADGICIKWRLRSCARVLCSGHRVSHLHKNRLSSGRSSNGRN